MYSSCRLHVYFVLTCFSWIVFIWLDRWFSRLNGLTLVMFGPLYSLLFGVSQGSVLKAVPWPIMIYFYKLLFIVIWMESCLIGTHTKSSYRSIYIQCVLGYAYKLRLDRQETEPIVWVFFNLNDNELVDIATINHTLTLMTIVLGNTPQTYFFSNFPS